MSLNHQKSYNEEIRAWLLEVAEYAEYISKQNLVRRACPVCGAKSSSPFANNGHLSYEQCVECSLVFMNPALDLEAVDKGFKGDDELLMKYFHLMIKYKTGLPAKPDPKTDSKLKDIYSIKATGSLLDVGCSVGDFLHKAKHFYDVEGVEVNPYTAEIAGKHFKIYRDYLKNIKMGKKFDIVTLHQILYGVPDPVSLLKDIYLILEDDGILYINTPNVNSYAVDLFKGKANHLYGYTALNVFNPRAVEKLASIAGFKVRMLRTEWLDIYTADIIEYCEHPDLFVHKRNCYVDKYEEKIKTEDELHSKMYSDLGLKGNYLVAILQKV